ncbi:hypothetical protein GOV03_00010 [Candidatus Woesearchaeota archaeon]|nr:hypothetical protein [Candidatus Woesearchaeota archaeon]
MVEENLVINNRIISHQGIFRVDELFDTINSTVTKLGYQKREKKTEETVFPSGKKTLIELRPFKIKTNYVTLTIKIRINLDKVIETAQEVDGVKRNFQQGDVKIVLDAWSSTDYQSRWGMKPFFFFLKAVINKYVYHFSSKDNFVGELKSDTDQLTEQIKGLLNLYKYQVAKEQIK